MPIQSAPAEISTELVRKALNRMYAFELLGRLPIALSDIVEERLEQWRNRGPTVTDRGRALCQIIAETIDVVFPQQVTPSNGGEGKSTTRPSYGHVQALALQRTLPAGSRSQVELMGESLRLRYVDRMSRAEAASRLEFAGSMSAYDRLHEKAVERLATDLHIRNLDAARRRSRQNRIEQIVRPIHSAFEKGRYDDVLTASKAVFALLYDVGFWEDYLDISEKAVRAAEELGREDEAAEIRVGNIARVYVDQKKMDEALAQARVVLCIAEKRGMYRAQGEAYRILGIVKRERQDYHGSIEDLYRSRDAFKKMGDDLRYLQISGILAVDLRRCHRWQEAESLLKELLAKFDELADKDERRKGVAMTHCRLGTLFYERAMIEHKQDRGKFTDDLDQARASYLKALEIESTLSRQRSLAMNYRKLSLVEIAAGNLDEASKRLDQAKRFFEARGYPEDMDELSSIETQLSKARGESHNGHGEDGSTIT